MVGKWVENPIKSIKNDQKRSQQSENGSRKFEKKTNFERVKLRQKFKNIVRMHHHQTGPH